MDKTVLENLINQGLTQRAIANRLGKCQATIKHWLKKYQLRTIKAILNRHVEFKCLDCGELDESKSLKLKKNGIERNHKSLCVLCHKIRTIKKQREYKQKAVDYKGGKCIFCGYCKCIGSLHFHHPDPSKKEEDFENVKNMSFEKMKPYIDKCQLVCGNCHGEIHYNETEV